MAAYTVRRFSLRAGEGRIDHDAPGGGEEAENRKRGT